MDAPPSPPLPSRRPTFLLGGAAVLVHVFLLPLDGVLVATAGHLAAAGEGGAPFAAAALTGLVLAHLLSVAWTGRWVVTWVEDRWAPTDPAPAP